MAPNLGVDVAMKVVMFDAIRSRTFSRSDLLVFMSSTTLAPGVDLADLRDAGLDARAPLDALEFDLGRRQPVPEARRPALLQRVGRAPSPPPSSSASSAL